MIWEKALLQNGVTYAFKRLSNVLIMQQFALDIQFLIGIAKFGGYCTENIMNASMTLLSHMESVFLSAGIDPKR